MQFYLNTIRIKVSLHFNWEFPPLFCSRDKVLRQRDGTDGYFTKVIIHFQYFISQYAKFNFSTATRL